MSGGCFIFHFIAFGGHLGYLTYYGHKSGYEIAVFKYFCSTFAADIEKETNTVYATFGSIYRSTDQGWDSAS